MRLNAQPEGAFPKPRGGVDRISVNYKTIDTNGIVKIVSDCGHYIHADKPQVFCQAVWDFIDCL